MTEIEEKPSDKGVEIKILNVEGGWRTCDEMKYTRDKWTEMEIRIPVYYLHG